MSPELYPPFRFGGFEKDVYRGAYPRERNFTFLKRYRLRTVLSLIPEQPNANLVKFCFTNHINNLWIRVNKPKENIPLSYSKIIRCIQVLIQPENFPIYIHCLDGTVVTGIVLACLRKLQMWPVTIALTEYLRFTSDEEFTSEERDFVGRFMSPIDIPNDFPPWLFRGVEITSGEVWTHPSIPCRFAQLQESLEPIPQVPHHHYLHLTRKEEAQLSIDQRLTIKSPRNETSLGSSFKSSLTQDGSTLSNPEDLGSVSYIKEPDPSQSTADQQLSMTLKALALESFRP